MFKRILFSIVLTIFFLPTLAAPAAALDLGVDGLAKDAAAKAGYASDTDETTLAKTIGTIIKAALSLVGIAFTVLMVYAGDMWMTARGDADRVEKAKKLITEAVIGLVVTLAAYAISNLAVNAILDRALGTQNEPPPAAPQ